MRTLGLCVGFSSASRPIVRGIVMDGDPANPTVDQPFEIKTGSEDLADQLDDLTRGLRSKVSGFTVDRVVIRVADFNRNPSNKPGPRHRLMLEGAIMFAMREIAPGEVYARNGKELGEIAGTSKDEEISRGKTLYAKGPDAAAAALSGLY